MSAKKDRAEDKTVLGVSMPKELKERIAAIAKKDHRDMAPWCVIQLENAVREIEEAQELKCLPTPKANQRKTK